MKKRIFLELKRPQIILYSVLILQMRKLSSMRLNIVLKCTQLDLEIQLPFHTDLFPKVPASTVMPQVQKLREKREESFALYI